MRKSEKEILDKDEINKIIQKADVCRLGFSVDNVPYIIPMNFGYKDNCLYFHCAKEGKKIDMIRNNPNVCFEIDVDHVLVTGEKACNWTMKYKSVIGMGVVEVVNDPQMKREALDTIMVQYTDVVGFEYSDKAVDAVKIIKVIITEISGKKSGY